MMTSRTGRAETLVHRTRIMLALALALGAAPLDAQDMHVVSLEKVALTDRDAARVVTLLDAWRRNVQSIAAARPDPLASIRAVGTEVVVPPGATYDPLCSAARHEAVFTMGEEPSVEEVVELTDLTMRAATVLASTPAQETAPKPRKRDPAAAMSMLDGLIKGAMEGKSAPTLLAGEEGAAVVAAELRRHGGVTGGSSQRRVAWLDAWYAEQGFGRESHGETGDETGGVLLSRTTEDGTPGLDVELTAYNEDAGFQPLCGLAPRGPRVMLKARATPSADLSPAAIEASSIALFGSGTGLLHERFASAIRQEGLDYPRFLAVLRATIDARWLASQPELRRAMVATAQRDPSNGAAAVILQHDRNVAWYERNRHALDAAIARWSAVFTTR